METNTALSALAALAQDTRLAAYRALVQAGPNGIAAGLLSEKLGVPCQTLSFHLAQLRHAGLITQRRDGRSLIYAAAYDAMNGLIAFLTENCCAGAACGPVCSPTPKQESPHETPARSRRRSAA